MKHGHGFCRNCGITVLYGLVCWECARMVLVGTLATVAGELLVFWLVRRG